MDNILGIWEAIVQETIEAQEMQGENRGFVKNFLINGIYHRETSFTAKIFAAEYIRTNNQEFYDRTKLALNALCDLINSKSIKEGFDEPMITPRGVFHRKGSIPATILLIESATEAARIIGYDFNFDVDSVVEYLKHCYLGGGRFYHDVIEDKNKKYPHVVNVTAMSFYFLEMIKDKIRDKKFYELESNKIKNAIISSIRSDGFSPYIEPQRFQKVFFAVSNFLPNVFVKAYNKVLSDSSIFFGDAIHHTITFYYLIKGLSLQRTKINNKELQTIKKGWLFIKKNLREYKKEHILFDFSWEPKPTFYRHSNFIDTTTYFYIFDFIRYLGRYNIISDKEMIRYYSGMANHIISKLMRKNRVIPSIDPYEGPDSIKEKIMPRPSEAVFYKGALLSPIVLELICERNGYKGKKI